MTESPWEDALLERKLESDQKDFLKTFVAFANSVRPGHAAVVLIGERNDGSVQGVSDPDEMQKKIRRECERIYPSIVWRSRVYEHDGKHCVRVEIEYSGETPHFGEAAWIRRGSETVKASDEIFQRLIELRFGMVRELSQWLGKEIIVGADPGTLRRGIISIHNMPRWGGFMPATLHTVNAHWATFELSRSTKRSEPIEKLMLSWADEKDCLLVLVRP
jgi:Putative DNA-binding domain